MRKLSLQTRGSFPSSINSFTLSGAFAADFKREVIYQIITDRFFDGNSANNNPAQSAGLYDSTKTNWRLYWGGDLQGIQAEDVVPRRHGRHRDLDFAARR